MNTVGIDKHLENFYNSLRIRYPNQITSTHESNSTDQQRIYGRENVEQQLLDALQYNYVNINSPNTHEHKICTALGFYGLGKTAVGTEVASQLIFNNRPVKHAIVDFETMVDGIDSQHLVDYNTFSTHLSMRILSRLITGKIYRHVITNSYSFDFLVKDLKDNILDLNTILRFYGEKENVAAFVIQFDKLHHLTMQARQYLLEYIGNAFSPQNGQPVLFLPLITGSSCLFERVVDRSPFAHEKLLLNAIPQQSIEEMITARTTLDEALVTRVKGSYKFQMLAKTTLGVPRIVRRLAEAMAKADLVKIQDFKELIANISSEFVKGAGRMYSISQWTNWYPGENSVLRLLALILRGEICLTGHVNETDVSFTIRLPGIPNELKSLPGSCEIKMLYDAGYFHVANSLLDRQQITFPYALLSALCREIHLQSGCFGLLRPIEEIECLDLEDLEPLFLELIVHSYNAIQQGLVVNFSDIWRGAAANENILLTKVKIPRLFDVVTRDQLRLNLLTRACEKDLLRVKCTGKNDFDLRTTNGSVQVSPLHESFTIMTAFDLHLEASVDEPLVVVEEKGSRKRKVVSGTLPNKIAKINRPKKLLNITNTRGAVGPNATVKASDIYKWYNDVRALEFENFLTVFSYFTNNNIEWDAQTYSEDSEKWTQDELLRACPNLVLMSRAQLAEYLTPTFEPLCRPATLGQ